MADKRVSFVTGLRDKYLKFGESVVSSSVSGEVRTSESPVSDFTVNSGEDPARPPARLSLMLADFEIEGKSLTDEYPPSPDEVCRNSENCPPSSRNSEESASPQPPLMAALSLSDPGISSSGIGSSSRPSLGSLSDVLSVTSPQLTKIETKLGKAGFPSLDDLSQPRKSLGSLPNLPKRLSIPDGGRLFQPPLSMNVSESSDFSITDPLEANISSELPAPPTSHSAISEPPASQHSAPSTESAFNSQPSRTMPPVILSHPVLPSEMQASDPDITDECMREIYKMANLTLTKMPANGAAATPRFEDFSTPKSSPTVSQVVSKFSEPRGDTENVGEDLFRASGKFENKLRASEGEDTLRTPTKHKSHFNA